MAGSGLGSIQKIWDPYLFLQPLKLQLQIWYTTWTWGVAYIKETIFTTKIGGGLG